MTLLLSDGRTIESSPVILHRGKGGPAGLYYQIVRGPSPIPISLTELDSHGHKLRNEKLNRIVECTDPELRYLPGGLHTLIRSTVPRGGPAFSIIAQHYRFLGHTYFEVTLREKPLSGTFGGEVEGGFSSSGGESFGAIVLHKRGAVPDPFARQQSSNCLPHPYAIVYGLLKPPGASVLARIDGKTQQLRRVRIPMSMHVRGVLAYAILPTLPEKLIVRSAQGRVLSTEDLGSAGKEAIETCEGEAEG